jgi:hypothetical protein
MDTMTSDDYLKAHRASGIEVGDKVRVLRSAKHYEQGWENCWDEFGMDNAVGGIFEVLSDNNGMGFMLSYRSEPNDLYRKTVFNFPWFVLEVIEKKKKCPVQLDFGCVDPADIEEAISDYITTNAIRLNYPQLGIKSEAMYFIFKLVNELRALRAEKKHVKSVAALIYRIFCAVEKD